jgi:exonuclease III
MTDESGNYTSGSIPKHSTWRIVIGNINSFPNNNDGNNKYKLDNLQKLVQQQQCDILLISEHNRNLNNTPRRNHPAEILKRWWQQTIVRGSYLVSTSKSSFEPGGTMIVTNTRSTAHTCSADLDSHSLGRWNLITLKGKRDHYTTLISIYRPSPSQATYLRHMAYTAKRRKAFPELSPDKLWYIDLQDIIQEKITAGHQVIVAGDFNDDLNDEEGKTRLFMHRLGLREIMIDSYGRGPATHIRGTTTIDGVFATNKIKLSKGYYLPFDRSPSDHRWIVLDVDEDSLLGTARDDISPPLLRKVTSKIPSVKESFQRLLDQQVKRYHLWNHIEQLYQGIVAGQPFTALEAKIYEAI